MQFCKNRNGEFEFYGHKQSHPFDFPFLKSDANVSILIQNESDLNGLQKHFEGEIPESFKLFSSPSSPFFL